jgi:hypothetical protein
MEQLLSQNRTVWVVTLGDSLEVGVGGNEDNQCLLGFLLFSDITVPDYLT